VIVVDTTVLVYAVGTEHPYRSSCRSLVEVVRTGAIRATTTVEVIQEFAHVCARRRGRHEARRLARAYAELLAPLLATSETNLHAGLDLWSRNEGLGAFDAVLAAVAHDIGAMALVSSDRAFANLEGVSHLLPDEAGLALLLG